VLTFLFILIIVKKKKKQTNVIGDLNIEDESPDKEKGIFDYQ